MKHFRLSVLSFLLLTLALMACKNKTTVKPTDIIGTWIYTGKEQCNEYNIAEIDLDYSNDIWVSPMLGDTIYHYERYAIHGDTLLLYDKNNDALALRMKYLGGDSLILESRKLLYKGLLFRKRNYLVMKLKSINRTDLSDDSCDIIVKASNPRDSLVAISKKDMLRAKAILKKHFETLAANKLSNPYSRRPLPFNEYIRQYYGRRRDGHLLINVAMMQNVDYFPDRPNAWYNNLIKQPYHVCDGGRYYADALIDLTTGLLVWFYVHGEA